MQSLESAFDPSQLAEEVRGVPYHRDSSGVEMAHLQGRGLPGWLAAYPGLRAAVAEIEDLTGKKAEALMLNRLGSGVEVPVHTDARGGERWHLPLQTNAAAHWWDAVEGYLWMKLGYWWGPVPYLIAHRVLNLGHEPRVHLVVDVREDLLQE